jgi:acyl-[acyl-carrier-protein] desaturase
MSIQNIRLEVMQFLEKNIDSFVENYLIPVEKIWQPSDLLPDSEKETFFEDVTPLPKKHCPPMSRGLWT